MTRSTPLLCCLLLCSSLTVAYAAPVVIEGVPKMDWSTGHFSLHISALYTALQAMGSPVPYEELMVASGAAFRIAWLPGQYHYGSAELAPEDMVLNAAEFAGGFGERRSHASSEEAWQGICESLDAGRPVLCWKGWGLAVICGYDAQAGGRLYLQQYQNATGEYSVVPVDLQDPPWPLKAPKEIVLLEYEATQPMPELDWPAILDRAIRWAEWPLNEPLYKQYPFGLAAYESWAQTLRGGMDRSGAGTDSLVTEFMSRVLADARASASLVLQDNATLHEAFADAASAYMNEAALLRTMPALLSQGNNQGPWPQTTAAMEACFPKQEVREQAAQLVEQAQEQELMAIEALKEALADLATDAKETETVADVPGGKTPVEPPPGEKTEPAEEAARDPEKAAQLVTLAKQAKDKRNYKEADVWLKAALKADPLSVEAHRVRAWVLIELHQEDEAATEFRKVIELAPDSDQAKEAQKALERLGR